MPELQKTKSEGLNYGASNSDEDEVLTSDPYEGKV